MRKLLALAAVMTMGAGVAMADPAEGMWKTQVDDGAYAHVKMSKCGQDICGVIAKSFKAEGEYNSPNKGKMLVRHMKPNGDGSYNGEVWRPSNNKIYVGKMSVNGNKLVLKGCVVGGLICSGQTWTRLK
ncbi:DUF2147 domain-containing protein [Aquicoccus sp. G2-2]|uniref:DUF2147 domain-containing protein n=1 Tax=Aquicoccus sp. G2-2 TaxID=3092120 RepID=UPI002AE05C8F|nr:DUF2147 domain-containing protein [Aquicoccus sp. G2-2]MEA1112626.1 DUF2147 domain-containing protein [Aquicoccus sp. G2-2]